MQRVGRSEMRGGGRPGRVEGARGFGGRRLAWVFLLAAFGWAGCGGPLLVFPGGELSGEVVAEPVEDWSFVQARFLDLETRPEDPYSVEINYFVLDGRLFIDPAEGRRWLEYIREDPRVRARLDGKIYPLRAVLVGRPGEIEGFDPTRYVYRLDPR